MASMHGQVAHLLNPNYKADVTRWLAEDCPSFDYGGFVVGDAHGEAKLLGKSAVCYQINFICFSQRSYFRTSSNRILYCRAGKSTSPETKCDMIYICTI